MRAVTSRSSSPHPNPKRIQKDASRRARAGLSACRRPASARMDRRITSSEPSLAPSSRDDMPNSSTAYTEAELLKAHGELTDKLQHEEAFLAKLTENKSINIRLAEALSLHSKRFGSSMATIRAIDLLKNWDINGDGQISKQEFLLSMVGRAPTCHLEYVVHRIRPLGHEVCLQHVTAAMLHSTLRPTSGLKAPPRN